MCIFLDCNAYFFLQYYIVHFIECAMRRDTAAPHFGLVPCGEFVCWRLTALCELQIGGSCVEESVVCLVLCWFLALSGCSCRPAKWMQQTMPKPCQNHKKGFGGGPNPWKMAPKSDSGRIFDAGWQRVVPGTMFWRHFGATWPILAAILVPAGSQNELFWHQISKKWEKWDPKKGVRKSMKK